MVIFDPVGRPEEHLPISLEEAVAQLRREPGKTVKTRLYGLDVELRAVPSRGPSPDVKKLGDWMADAGPWQGETEEEMLALLRRARKAGGTAEPPALP